MYRYVYTRCLEKADDIQTDCRQGLTKGEAKRLFNYKVREILVDILHNELVNCTMNIHKMKAVIQVESVRHVLAVQENA